MSKADTSTWTSLEFLASLLVAWSRGEERPASGSLVRLVTRDNQTTLEMA